MDRLVREIGDPGNSRIEIAYSTYTSGVRVLEIELTRKSRVVDLWDGFKEIVSIKAVKRLKPIECTPNEEEVMYTKLLSWKMKVESLEEHKVIIDDKEFWEFGKNYWSCGEYSEDEAKGYSRYMRNSVNCFNCRNCTGCVGLVRCSDCVDCDGGFYLDYCEGCYDTNYSHGSRNCSNCRDLQACTRMHDCFKCEDSHTCSNCYGLCSEEFKVDTAMVLKQV
jgi:hypothetical protein